MTEHGGTCIDTLYIDIPACMIDDMAEYASNWNNVIVAKIVGICHNVWK